MTLQDQTVARLVAASAAGVKISRIASEAGVKWWKVRALAAGTGDARNPPKLTDDECSNLNKALDAVKVAL